jgi:hypothetical protein
MNTIDKLVEISSRIEHLESVAEWIARETVNSDNAVSQSSTLICVLADDLRERIFALAQEFEAQQKSDPSFH